MSALRYLLEDVAHGGVAQASGLLAKGTDMSREHSAKVGRVIRIGTRRDRDGCLDHGSSDRLIGQRCRTLPGEKPVHVHRNLFHQTGDRMRFPQNSGILRPGSGNGEGRACRVRSNAGLSTTQRRHRPLLPINIGGNVGSQRVGGARKPRLCSTRDGRSDRNGHGIQLLTVFQAKTAWGFGDEQVC